MRSKEFVKLWKHVKSFPEILSNVTQKLLNQREITGSASQVIKVSLKIWGKHDRAFLISLTGCTISIIMNYKIVTKYVVRNYVDH